MSLRLTAIALASALLLASGGLSTADAQLLGGTRPLAVPITGSVSGGGSFAGTLSIQRFSVRAGAIVAVAAVAGATANVPGVDARTGLRASAEFPVTITQALGIAGRAVEGPRISLVRQTCGSAAHIQIGASFVDVAGVTVMTNPVVLDVGANSGGLVGSLVCQLLGLVGGVLADPFSVVSVLNQLLGQLTGLVGGATGGLLL